MKAIAPVRGAVAAVYTSAVLGVALGVDRQRRLRLYDAGRYAWYQIANEAQAEAQAERDARQQAEARWQMSDDDERDAPRPQPSPLPRRRPALCLRPQPGTGSCGYGLP